MVDPTGETSNHQLAPPDNLTALFETLADWEYQLRALPPEHLAYLERDVEEPTL